MKVLNKKRPPPLVRSRTLPAIVVPGLSILQAQIESKCKGESKRNLKISYRNGRKVEKKEVGEKREKR